MSLEASSIGSSDSKFRDGDVPLSDDDALLRPVRDLGLGIVQAIGPLRRAFMRQAAGLSGPLPRLLQGRPL